MKFSIVQGKQKGGNSQIVEPIDSTYQPQIWVDEKFFTLPYHHNNLREAKHKISLNINMRDINLLLSQVYNHFEILIFLVVANFFYHYTFDVGL